MKSVLAGLAALLLLAGAGAAQPIGDFYRGKSITLLISVGEGDGMDKTARLIARHWPNHLPGNPSFVPKNMPGAGNLRATDFLYNQAPKDGTTIAAIIPVFVLQQMFGNTGGMSYESEKFGWIGSSNSSNQMIYVWHAVGIRSLEEATRREVLMGATGVGSNSALYPTITNNVLGTRFKLVMGYRATPEIGLAMERGEVEGRAGETFNTLLANNAGWLEQKKIDILVQIGEHKEKGFEHIPLLTDFARDAGSRAVLDLFSEDIELGRPYLAPPGTPPDRLAALRRSLDATLADPALLAEAKAMRLDITPTKGEELQRLVATMMTADPAVLARAKAALEVKDAVNK